MAAAAAKLLQKKFSNSIPINIQTVQETHATAIGDGTGIIITAHTENDTCLLAASGLGAKGVPAYQVIFYLFYYYFSIM